MTTSRTLQFSLRQLLSLIAAAAVCIALVRLDASVLVAVTVLFVAAYLFAALVSARMRAIVAAVCALVAVLSWFSDPPLPFPHALQAPTAAFYWLVETPPYCIGAYAPGLFDVVFFPGEGVVTARPIAVSLFWLIPAVAFFTSTIVELCGGRLFARTTDTNLHADQIA